MTKGDLAPVFRSPEYRRRNKASQRARRVETRHGRAKCELCRQVVAVVRTDRLIVHGPLVARCPGSGAVAVLAVVVPLVREAS